MLWKQVMDRFGKKNLWVVGLSAVVMAGVAWIAVPLAKSHRNAAPAQTAFNSSAIDAAGSARVVPSFGPQPLSFEPNLGQTDPQVKFTARGSGYALFLTPAKAVVSLVSPDKTSLRSVKQRPSPSSASTGDVAPPSRRLSLRASRPQPRWRDALGTAGRMPALHQSVLGMEFVGAKDQAEIAGIDLVPETIRTDGRPACLTTREFATAVFIPGSISSSAATARSWGLVSLWRLGRIRGSSISVSPVRKV